jgi:hypothetical protein
MRVQVSPRAHSSKKKLDFQMRELYFVITKPTNMRIAFQFILLSFISWSVATSEIIKSSSLQASSDGVNITLRWVTVDETNVARFDIERRSESDGSYITIASVDPKGPTLYEFVDYSVFRKSQTVYHYRIKIVFSDGSAPVYTMDIPVSHTVSGVRRTWGSIKAMFRF